MAAAGEGLSSSRFPLERSGRGPKVLTDEASFLKVLGHPTRVRILSLASANETISPSFVRRITGIPLNQVVHHFRYLTECEALELVWVEVTKESVEHFYRGVRRAIWSRADLACASLSEKQEGARALLLDWVCASSRAIDSGSMFTHQDFMLSWEQLELDEKGRCDVAEDYEDLWRRIKSREEEAATRIQAGAASMKVLCGLANFETLPAGS